MQHTDCHMMACSSMSTYLVVSIAFLAESCIRVLYGARYEVIVASKSLQAMHNTPCVAAAHQSIASTD